MKKNIRIGVIAIIGLLMFNACNMSDNKNSTRRIKTMLIKSEGEISVEPDEAYITIHLSCTDKNIYRSKQCLVNKSEALNRSFENFGIKQKDILTTSINLNKDYQWKYNSQVFVGYKSSITTQLKIRDLKVLEDLYTSLLINKNVSIGNFYFSYSKMDSLNNAAYLKALDNANTLANQLLNNMDEMKKEVIRIGNTDLSNINNTILEGDYLMMSEISDNEADNRKISINSGTMYAYKSLIVEYKIE
jgi:uncharacterized protein YggE